MVKFPPKKIQKISALVLMVTATVMIFMTVASFFSFEKTSAEVGHFESTPYWQYVNNDFSAYVFNNKFSSGSTSPDGINKYYEQFQKEWVSDTFLVNTHPNGFLDCFAYDRVPVLVGGKIMYAFTLFFDTNNISSNYADSFNVNVGGTLIKMYRLFQIVLNYSDESFNVFGVEPNIHGRGFKDYYISKYDGSNAFCCSVDNYRISNRPLSFSVTFLFSTPHNIACNLWFPSGSYDGCLKVYCGMFQEIVSNAALTGNTRLLPYTNLDDPSSVENFNKGYNNGLEVGRKEGLRDGETIGFGKGLKEGKLQGNADINSTFESFFPSVFGGIATFLMTILDFKIFGISALTILGTFGAILLLGFIIKLVKG